MKRIAALVPRLPRVIWILEAVSLVSNLGTGLILPFQAIYLHNVRGFSLALTGAVVAAYPAFAFLGGTIGGTLTDRVGPRWTHVAGLFASAAALAAYGFATEPWQAFACSGVLGFAGGINAVSSGALRASLATPDQLDDVYGLSFAQVNLGIALGAGVAGFVAHSTEPKTYTLLFVLNAALTAASAVVTAAVTRGVKHEMHEDEGAPGSGYRELLRNRSILAFTGVTFLFVVVGIAAWEFAVPIFAKNDAGMTERVIGAVFFVNSCVIVLGQFVVLKVVRGRRRLVAIAAALVLWTGAWLLVAVAGQVGHTAAIAALIGVGILFALGECLVAPLQASVALNLVPQRLRGRSLALHSNTYALGWTVGPIVLGFGLSHAATAVWLIAAGVLVVTAGLAVLLDRAIPDAARRVPLPVPAVAEEERC
jgi:MFS family permease